MPDTEVSNPEPAAVLAIVRQAVGRRRPVDGREARSRHRMLVALGRLSRPFDQESDRTHVTGSSLIIGPRGVLLHLHKRLGLWLQPGGHLEPGETPWDAAVREAAEETGLEMEWASSDGGTAAGGVGIPPLAHLDVHDGGRGHTHLDLRYLLAVRGTDEPAPPVGESQEVRWFAWPEAVAIADAGLAGFLRAYTPPG